MRKMLFAVAATVIALTVAAQKPREFKIELPDSIRRAGEFVLPDSLAHMTPWKPEFRTMQPVGVKPVVSMTSVVAIQQEHLPSRVTVINNNTLRMGQHFNLSNGQAWNWSPFPDAYLDARTLSFPMRR